MSKARWTTEDFKKARLIETADGFVPGKNLVAKGKVEKIEPNVNSFNGAKIRNAVKSVVDGVSFDSNLEKYLYGLLKGAGIDFQFQKEYLLQEKFRYGTEAVRAITLTCDFFLPVKNMIIDTKGYANDRAPLKYKMLKWLLVNERESFDFPLPKIELPSTKKECDLLLNRILYEP